ncbi:hypothetical protein DCE93_01225 [Agromyces badenianii]|uniref:Lactococcin 972 family bacteriocin n=1 Tax=Agromyces badenianii TaxID=2080742 RepID=A0A2S0WSZ7_9MICO|nr:hypothetical protein DCE93_01225 [Agromyces badenianii]
MTAALVALAPVAAEAAEYNYFVGSATINQWYYSGHRDMNGARALATSPYQWLSLVNTGFTAMSGWDDITVSHSLTYTSSRCGWSNGSVAAGTSFSLVCKYWR